jgi:hypothetical protein
MLDPLRIGGERGMADVEQDFLQGAGKLHQRATVCTSTASNGP